MSAPVLGVIADDFTGATDVARMLVRAGMRTVQVIGVPQGPMSTSSNLVSVSPMACAAPSSTTTWWPFSLPARYPDARFAS